LTRLSAVAVINCHTDRADVAVTEVLNTQAQNVRAGADKTYQLIIEGRICDRITRQVFNRIQQIDQPLRRR